MFFRNIQVQNVHFYDKKVFCESGMRFESSGQKPNKRTLMLTTQQTVTYPQTECMGSCGIHVYIGVVEKVVNLSILI